MLKSVHRAARKALPAAAMAHRWKGLKTGFTLVIAAAAGRAQMPT
ncbi:hypothetical protein [Amorphus sp. MBR-141]